jgi:hypothetical protein
MNDSTPITQKHIMRVRELLDLAATGLSRRGIVHDASKFSEVEKRPLDEMQRLIDEEGQAPYGSDEYKRRAVLLGPMLEHHYANNSHHPEHYPDGVNGMDLFDVVEMFFDWKAASERGDESSIGLTHSVERFKIGPQLASILANTAERLGYAIK